MSKKETKDIQGLEINDLLRSTRPKGNNYLLAIAINQYVNKEDIPQLSNCVKDADDLITELTSRYQFSKEHVFRIFDEQATLSNIYKELKELSQKVGENDNVIIYFSGHGYYDKAGKSGHLIPVDGEKDAIWTYISNANLLSQIRAINSFHTFLIMDSCFSGSLFATKDIQTKSYEDKIGDYPSRLGFAAGMIEKVTDGFHGENSPFAKALITFLKNNKEEKTAASELMEYVKRATSNNAEQTPIGGPLFKVGDLDGQFIFELQKDEAADWRKAIATGTLSAYQHFLSIHPDGEYSHQAREEMTALKASSAWANIQSLPDEKEYEVRQKILAIHNFLIDFRKAKEIPQAEELGEQLEYKKDFLNAQDNLFALKRFARKNTPFKAAALERVKILEEAIQKEKQEKERKKEIEDARLKEEVRKKAAEEQVQLETEKRKAKEAQQKQILKVGQEEEGLKIADNKPLSELSFFKKYGKYFIALLTLSIVIWGIIKLMPGNTETGTFTDSRDGQVYKTVKLKDGNTWLAQNLNFKIDDGSWWNKDDSLNGMQYGRLYTWEAAKKACPAGWHLPSDKEWRAMTKHYGGFYDDAKDSGKAAYKALIDGGDSGFSALLGGFRSSDGLFYYLGDYGYYWSSTGLDSVSAWTYSFGKPNSKLYRGSNSKTLGFSCRCIQD